MKEKYTIEINEFNKPFNAYMVLPLSMFKRINKLLKEEILKGLVDSDQEDRIILHLLLDDSKIKKIRQFVSTLEKKGKKTSAY